MATIKVKLRPSRVVGKAGVIYYQITHNRKTRQITTKLRVQASIRYDNSGGYGVLAAADEPNT